MEKKSEVTLMKLEELVEEFIDDNVEEKIDGVKKETVVDVKIPDSVVKEKTEDDSEMQRDGRVEKENSTSIESDKIEKTKKSDGTDSCENFGNLDSIDNEDDEVFVFEHDEVFELEIDDVKKNDEAEKEEEEEVEEDSGVELIKESNEADKTSQKECSEQSVEDSAVEEGKIEFPPDLSKWMQNLPENLKDIPISKICMPGSHDTGAFQLHAEMPLAHDQKFSIFLRALGKLRVVRNIIKNWSETQSLSIADQLKLGVRYLDLRVELAMTPSYEINPFLVHGLYGVTGPPFMKEIKKFLDENTEEIVIVDVNHVYQMTEVDFLIFFVRPMERIFGRDAFCPVMVDLTDSTLNELVETNHRLIVVGPYSHDIDRIVYSRYAIASRWPDVNNIYNLIGAMRTEIRNEYPNLHVLQGVMTARATDIGRHLFNSLKNVFSMDSLRATIDFVNTLTYADRQNLNIVISDQINEEFTRAVIDQNTKVHYENEMY